MLHSYHIKHPRLFFMSTTKLVQIFSEKSSIDCFKFTIFYYWRAYIKLLYLLSHYSLHRLTQHFKVSSVKIPENGFWIRSSILRNPKSAWKLMAFLKLIELPSTWKTAKYALKGSKLHNGIIIVNVCSLAINYNITGSFVSNDISLS